jgi:uncharacterized protein YbjT (DUF2867 family)
MTSAPARRLLLTGATGFVGRALWPILARAGYEVRCLTRHVDSARRHWPDRHWVEGDVADPVSLARALAGCDAGFYLVHGMAEGDHDYRRREVAAAEGFARTAAAVGLGRIVYLGGLEPRKHASEHLRSRLEVGEVLRAGAVPTVELRASMIIGHGSLSWLIVRDLAARLPVMVLPRWLESRTEPVAIDDVVVALVRALDLELKASECFDLPGAEVLSGRQILERTAAVMGLHRPLMIEVPVLSPRLSSHWVRFVTRANWAVAQEVVLGLTEDLLARDARYWQRIGHVERMRFDEAARRALAAERTQGLVPGRWGWMERWLTRLRPA